MNDNTLITVHCYAGDADRVCNNLECYTHHQRPVFIMSPIDSPVYFKEFVCVAAGGVGYTGQVSLDRQVRHMEQMLASGYEYFLANDSDSFCLSAEIPPCYYNSPDVFWSGEVTEPRPHPSPYPKLAFQPPYFFNRRVLEKMLAVAPGITAHPITPFIDWFMVALVSEAGIEHRAHANVIPPAPIGTNIEDPWGSLYYDVENRGHVMMHPIKQRSTTLKLLECRLKFEINSQAKNT